MTQKSQSISTSNPLEKPNDTLAICALDDDKKDQNSLYLTADNFIVIRNNSRIDFTINELNVVRITKVKLLFYVIVGGIIAPMSLLAISERLLETSLLLIIFIAAMGILLYGLNGSFALKVFAKSHTQVIPLTTTLPNDAIHNFVNFVNYVVPQLQMGKDTVQFYAVRNSVDDPYQLQPAMQGAGTGFQEIVKINLLKLTTSVELQVAGDHVGMVIPYINKQAILEHVK
jgi:hypothetical protein